MGAVPLANNAQGRAELDKQIARLRELGNLRSRSAPLVAQAAGEETSKTIAAGVSPSGQPWRQTKDGRAPLRNAAKALIVKVVGSVILMELRSPEARHHLGAIKGKIQRRIIPTGSLPGPFIEAIKRVVAGEFFSIMETTDAL